jgi:hypothetical protein
MRRNIFCMAVLVLTEAGIIGMAHHLTQHTSPVVGASSALISAFVAVVVLFLCSHAPSNITVAQNDRGVDELIGLWGLITLGLIIIGAVGLRATNLTLGVAPTTVTYLTLVFGMGTAFVVTVMGYSRLQGLKPIRELLDLS